MAEYLLAADGGGTKTEVVCTTLEGEVVGKGLSGPTNLTSTSIGAASFNLKEAIRQAIETLPAERSFPVLTMGLAGMDSPAEEAVAHRVFSEALTEYQIGKLVLVNDSLIALMNGTTEPNGIVVIAGTGSIAFGRTQDGRTARAGGMDYLLADQGSGYAIGLAALQAAVKSYDGRLETSLLEALVREHFSVASIEDLKSQVYNPVLTKIEIAELSHVCFAAHAQGDPAATAILEQATLELVALARAVTLKLGLGGQNIPVVLAGAVLQQDPVKSKVAQLLEQEFSHRIIFPENTPVFGAINLAMQTFHGEKS